VVLSIWHPVQDLGAKTKDMPCNDMIMLDIVDDQALHDRLQPQQRRHLGRIRCQRRAVLHAAGVMAAMIGVGVGHYCQMSNNFHVYVDNPYWLKRLPRGQGASSWNPYEYPDTCKPSALATTGTGGAGAASSTAEQLAMRAPRTAGSFGNVTFSSPFFERTVRPMLQSLRVLQARAT
jgi:hypothetical protein